MKNTVSFEDIELVFDQVSSAPPETNQAYVSRSTGQVYYISGWGDSDELPDDFEESDDYLEIPHKNDLDLGKELVLDFVADRLPDLYGEVDHIFSSRGAYGRFKQLLERHGALQDWHTYESQRTQQALRQWCREQGLNVD